MTDRMGYYHPIILTKILPHPLPPDLTVGWPVSDLGADRDLTVRKELDSLLHDFLYIYTF